MVIMGSGGETTRETVRFLQAKGERVGVAQLRLYRPFPARELAAALPDARVQLLSQIGHHLPRRGAAEIAAALVQFLAALDSDRPAPDPRPAAA